MRTWRADSDAPRGGAPPAGYSRALLYPSAILTLGAAAIHFAVAPAHLDEYLPFGLFFLALGVAQVALALATALRPARRLFIGAALGTLGVLTLWLTSRTVGLPLGPAPWRPEEIGFTDVICAALEALSIPLFLLLAVRRPRSGARRSWRVALATAPSLLLVAALTAAAVGAAASGMPDAFNASPAPTGQPSTSVVSLTEPPGPESVESFTLTPAVSAIDGREAWAYNGTVPGPELRVTQGDRVRVTLVNHLPAATTIHWHGVRVPNAADGVAGVTQDAVPPGGSFTYEFVARDAGTYWYHSHQDTEAQLSRGLFGALVVEPRAGRVADHDYAVVLHAPPGGGGVAMNGTTGDLHLAARPGDTVRLRLINAVAPGLDGGPEAPVLLGAPYRVVALDGQELSGPQALGPERVPLGMGQRADLLFTMPVAGSVRLVDTALKGAPSALGASSTPAGSVTIGDGPAPEAI